LSVVLKVCRCYCDRQSTAIITGTSRYTKFGPLCIQHTLAYTLTTRKTIGTSSCLVLRCVVFRCGPGLNSVNSGFLCFCTVDGEENPQNCPIPWDFVTLPEEDRATAIGNMHRKIGKDHVRDSGDILADRHTDTQTDVLITILRHRSRGQSNSKRTHIYKNIGSLYRGLGLHCIPKKRPRTFLFFK